MNVSEDRLENFSSFDNDMLLNIEIRGAGMVPTHAEAQLPFSRFFLLAMDCIESFSIQEVVENCVVLLFLVPAWI